MSRVIACAPGPYAVVIPVDPAQPVRVIDWPAHDDMTTLYREIDATTVGMRTAGGVFAFWINTEISTETSTETSTGAGADTSPGIGTGTGTGTGAGGGARWVANGRAVWLATALQAPLQLVAGTVVITLVAPDADDNVAGLSRETADALADIARGTPRHDIDALTRLLGTARDLGPVVIVLDAAVSRAFPI